MISASAFSANVAALSAITMTLTNGKTKALSIATLANLRQAQYARDCPYLYPQFNFQSGLGSSIASSGLTDPLIEWTWTANYYYAHAPIGAGRNAVDHDESIAINAAVIASAIQAATYTLGVKYITVAAITDPAVVPASDNQQFYGCEIALNIFDWTNN